MNDPLEDFRQGRANDRAAALFVLTVLLGVGLLFAIVASRCGEPTCVTWRRSCEASKLFTARECAQQAFLRFGCAP